MKQLLAILNQMEQDNTLVDLIAMDAESVTIKTSKYQYTIKVKKLKQPKRKDGQHGKNV